jgi:hypothetical protein
MSEPCPFNQRMFRPQVQSEAEEVWLSIGRIFHRLTLTGQVSLREIYFFSAANLQFAVCWIRIRIRIQEGKNDLLSTDIEKSKELCKTANRELRVRIYYISTHSKGKQCTEESGLLISRILYTTSLADLLPANSYIIYYYTPRQYPP